MGDPVCTWNISIPSNWIFILRKKIEQLFGKSEKKMKSSYKITRTNINLSSKQFKYKLKKNLWMKNHIHPKFNLN